MRVAACLYVRDEERDIAEWVIYHAIVGFDAFIIYDNASSDRTPLIVDRLRRIYNIKLISWPRATKYSQLEAYDDCVKNYRDDFDWIAFIDADEFVCPIRDGNVHEFVRGFDHANAIALNWSLFGSSGHNIIPSGLVISSFTKRAAEDFNVNKHTKMLVRPSCVIKIVNPHSVDVDGISAIADGAPLVRQSSGISVSTAGFDVCRINHYFVKSKEHWDLKLRRGYREGVRPAEHFAAHDVNDVEDTWAASHAKSVIAGLKASELLLLRPAAILGPTARDDAEKSSFKWEAIRCEVDDVMFKAPEYARQEGNVLFDGDYYLRTYPDVKASGIDPFTHFRQSGFDEGRRPCSQEAVISYLRKIGRNISPIEILRSSKFDGNRTFVARDPDVLHLRDYIYCPQNVDGCVPGVFDFGRKLVYQSVYARGPRPSDNLPNRSMPFDYNDISDYAEDGTYIYLGGMHPHFGHFLLSTLSRLWCVRSLPSCKIIAYGPAYIDIPIYMRILLEAFDVDASRIEMMQKPVKIKNLLLPCPSIEEQNYIHKVFSSAYKAAGDYLARDASLSLPGDGPIYLSKSRIAHGVRKIINEYAIDEHLQKNGICVVHPETLSIGEQVALWRLGRPVIGFSGSGLLTSAFSQGARVTSLRWDNVIDTTFPLVAWACGHSFDFRHVEHDAFQELGPTEGANGLTGLSSRLIAHDPVGIAEAILRISEEQGN